MLTDDDVDYNLVSWTFERPALVGQRSALIPGLATRWIPLLSLLLLTGVWDTPTEAVKQDTNHHPLHTERRNMFTVLFIGAIVLGLLVCVAIGRHDGWDEGVFCGVITAGIFASIVFIAGSIAAAVSAPSETRYVDIYSMGDGLGSEGHFFGGFGSIDSEAVFMYYTKDGDYYKLRHVDADRVRIIQDDSESPHFEKQCKNYDHTPNWLKMPQPMQSNGIACSSETELTFFVPTGSIKQQFNLDAQ